LIRVWSGHLYGKLYNGDIVLNPDYDECGSDGGGGPGGLEEPMTTCSGGGGGPDGGSSTWRCYTVTIDHYYYYPDTGEIEYRHTEQYSYCEEIE
jgi:hypothetical protein